MKKERPERVTLWRENEGGELEIDFKHPLSDGFGIPAVVINCPIETRFKVYAGIDQYGNKVRGVSFDECAQSCCCFDCLDFSQAIICRYGRQYISSSG